MTATSKTRIAKLRALWIEKGADIAEKEVGNALRLTPKDPNLLHLGAELAEKKGQGARAVQLLRRAVAGHPDFTEAAYNLARLLGAQKSYTEAIQILVKLTQAAPQVPLFWHSLSHFYQAVGDIPQAIEALRVYKDLVPTDTTARGLFYLLNGQICAWGQRPLRDGGDIGPHATIVFFDDPEIQKEAARRYAQTKFGAIRPLPALDKKNDFESKRIRVGYLSSDFHAHATAWLMAELFELHDKNRFEVFVYSYGIEDHSPVRQRIRAAADHFVVLNDKTSLACAQTIQADDIDILIDLKGYTRGSHLDILAYRPVHLQGHWLGYPGTLGADFVDVYFADLDTVPCGNEAFFTERVIRLPQCYQINDRKRQAAMPLSREAYGLPEKGLVVASFNQTLKITPELFDVWCEILKSVPESVLWLFESNAFAVSNLRREAEQRGLDSTRLIFAKPVAVEDHLARYELVDLALDTYPYGGHTTTSDALWMGVPVVTWRGRAFPSRVAASLLGAVELSELVTLTPESYAALAVRLLRDPQEIQRIKRHLVDHRLRLPLFDTPRFVRDWEEALDKVVRGA